MNNTKITNSSGLGFPEVLTIVFVVLKLTGVIAWSWWWVLSPILIPAAIVFIVFIVLVISEIFNS